MMDVRAPVEYEKGSFPSATNHPLMNNDERRVVGIRYKEQGPDAACELGNLRTWEPGGIWLHQT